MRLVNTITDENGEEFEIADKECREKKLDKADLPKGLSAFENDKGFIDRSVSDLENYHTKEETYTREETDEKIRELSEGGETANRELSRELEALKKDLSNYYTKADTYTQEEIDELLARRLNFEVVYELPMENIGLSTIYLVRRSSGGNGKPSDAYDEYIYANGGWELIGDTDIDLSGYYTKEETDGLMRELSESGGEISQQLDVVLNRLSNETAARQEADDDFGKRIDGLSSSVDSLAARAAEGLTEEQYEEIIAILGGSQTDEDGEEYPPPQPNHAEEYMKWLEQLEEPPEEPSYSPMNVRNEMRMPVYEIRQDLCTKCVEYPDITEETYEFMKQNINEMLATVIGYHDVDHLHKLAQACANVEERLVSGSEIQSRVHGLGQAFNEYAEWGGWGE